MGQFDLWGDGYAAEIHLLDEKDEYPVAGYRDLLNQVYQKVHELSAKKILELGFGTAILTKKLYQDGIRISGVDVSESVVDAGKEDMPEAHLICDDYELGMPMEFLGEKFDAIIATYAFHALDHYEKADLIEELLEHLNPGGKVIIGDIAFESKKEMKEHLKDVPKTLKKHDFPLLHHEAVKDFPELNWTKISGCAAIMEIER